MSYNKQRLHKVGYFAELLATNEEIHDSMRPLLQHVPGSTSIGRRSRTVRW